MESLKNLMWLAVGGFVLLMLMGVSPEEMESAVDDMVHHVQREVQNTGHSSNGHHSPSNSSQWINNDFESQAASRPSLR